ncbi:MAG: ATP-binding protein [Spirulinaceae cyanobacterium]
MKPKKVFGLRLRITLIISLTVVLPMTAAMAIASYRSRVALTEDAKAELETKTNSLQIHIEQWDRNMVNIITNLSRQPNIISMNPELQKSVLDATDEVYQEIYLLHTINLDGFNIARSDDKELTNYRDRTYFKEALKGKQAPRQILIGRTYPKPSVTFAAPIRNNINELIGVVSMSTALDDVSSHINEVNFDPGAIAIVVDSQNNLLAHSDLSTVPEQFQDLLNVSDSQEVRNLSDYIAVQKLRSGRQGWGSFIDSNGVKWICYTTSVSEAGWGIIVQQTEASFYAQARQFSLFSLLIGLLVLTIVSLSTWLVATNIVKPIRELTEAADAIAQGKLNQKVKTHSKDELGILAKVFNSMASQLKSSFEEIETKNKDLQKLDKLKDDFLANTSHELRTPLYGIIGITEGLLDGIAGKLPPKATENLNLVMASSRRLASLVNDILDFSKLENNHMELQIKPVDLQALIKITIALSSHLIKNKSLEIIDKSDRALPLVAADENRVQQILYNLLGNAIKFTETGTIEVITQLDETTTPHRIITQIKDTGIGIAPEKLNRIFESFEQGDGSTSRNYGGTGLGLTITKRLVELQAGEIWVESTLGVGSCFSFSLPVAQEQNPVKSTGEFSPPRLNQVQTLAAEWTEEPTGRLQINLAADSNDIKILIVDDEPINLQILLNNLSLENYCVIQAQNGLEALNLLDEGLRPDLILLDVMMPHLTGYEVAQKIRKLFLPSQLPIVMLTAKNRDTDVLEGFACGANDYLLKPFSKKELLARIKTHLNLARINISYARFVPQDFLGFLGRDSIIDVQLGDRVAKEMSILFSDMRSFTTISEGMTPEENFDFINNYLSQISPLIRAQKGFIDKYIGDAIMALFPADITNAVDCAIAMQQQVRKFNQTQLKKGAKPVQIGIGIHYGSLMIGTVGEVQRMDSTVIADSVNLASRLETLTKTYGVGIIISEAIFERLEAGHPYILRYLDRVKVKGKHNAVSIYEVLNGDEEEQLKLKQKTLLEYEQALQLYEEENYTAAAAQFNIILKVNSQDKVAALYRDRCQIEQQQ